MTLAVIAAISTMISGLLAQILSFKLARAAQFVTKAPPSGTITSLPVSVPRTG